MKFGSAWEELTDPVDRIVSIGRSGFREYDDYFKKTYELMPDDGVMLLHHRLDQQEKWPGSGYPTTMSLMRFFRFHRHPRSIPAAAFR